MSQTIAKCCHIVDGAVYRTYRQLGERFVRVHRAYIVNADRTRGVTAACVEVDGVRIEFLRKYRKLAVTRLAGRG
ncbi:MAG: hypothetical protein K2P46_00790 [Alistipes sp.]|nr:hypothetical protein [Alistipes sp.]